MSRKNDVDVLQDSPRTTLDTPVKTKNLLSRTNTPPAKLPFGFKLHERLALAYSCVRLFRPPFTRKPTSTAARRLGLTDEPRQPEEEKGPSPNRCGGSVHPGRVTAEVSPDSIFTGPSHFFFFFKGQAQPLHFFILLFQELEDVFQSFVSPKSLTLFIPLFYLFGVHKHFYQHIMRTGAGRNSWDRIYPGTTVIRIIRRNL